MPPTRAGHTPRPRAHRRAPRPRAARLSPFGTLLRQWRERRRLSQLGLAMEAEVSTRHLSFVENGRAAAHPGMRVTLARATRCLRVPSPKVFIPEEFFPAMSSKRGREARKRADSGTALEFMLRQQEPF